MPFEKSAGAVVFRKEKNKIYYLLLHYEMGHLGFPKGHIEKGETQHQTALREIREETGLTDIKFIDGFEKWYKYFFKLKGKNIVKIATFFLGQTKTKKVTLSFEHIGYKWLTFKQALEQLTFDNDKKILSEANQYLQSRMASESKSKSKSKSAI